MQNDEILPPHVLYKTYLKEIGGVKLTSREMSLVACFISGRSAKTIASFLSIAPKTVESHTRNIMIKLGCSSREGIINFVEKSGKYKNVKAYYSSLLIEIAFQKFLKEVNKLLPEKKSCILLYDNKIDTQLFNKLKHDFDSVGIQLTLQRSASSKESTPIISFEIKGEEIIINSNTYPYYDGVFEILKRLYPKLNFQSSIDEFYKQAEGMEKSAEEKNKLVSDRKGYPLIFSSKSLYIGLAFFLLITLTSTLFLQTANNKKEISVRSDIPLPNETALLQRPQLLQVLEEKLNAQDGIKTVALVGTGGAGKTTLARQFAKLQKGLIVWEINAETNGSLLDSFASLAYALCQTEEEKKTLKEVQLITKPSEKEEKIILFVKERLKLHPNWCLIFDNVEKFTDVQKYFPKDVDTWGKGKVIVTTRDSTIQNNKHINCVLEVGELDSKQKFNLFTKIMEIKDIRSLDSAKLAEIRKFLIEIPSFPLDISISAYYLKATGISYHNYLENLKRNHKDFTDVQEELLKESGDYFRTRYSIITLSLQHLIETHKDFGALLLFISLLDSQNIPKDLLNNYKNDEVLDSFIYHLKKYSLITNESIACSVSSISIHRSTQAICLNYLNKCLNMDQRNQAIKMISNALDSYLDNAIDEDDLLKMKNHCEVFLSHSQLLPDVAQGVARAGLGAIYFYLGNYKKTKDYLERNITNINANDKLHHSILARSLAYLGTTYKSFGQYEEAKKYLEKSLAIYRAYLPENHVKVAWILSQIGIVYRERGDYEMAQDFIKQGLMLYKQYLPKGHTKIAWALVMLATVQIEQGNYKEAQKLLEKSLIAYQNPFFENHIRVAWILAHLGIIYNEHEDHVKAKEILEKSLIVYHKYIFDNHIEIVRALRHLGNAYKGLGNYEKAKACLKESIDISDATFGKDHIDIALGLISLADTYNAEGKIDLAEEFIKKASLLLQQKKHPTLYLALEKHGDFCVKKASAFAKEGKNEQSQSLITQARGYLEQALKIVETRYPKESSYHQRIHSKLSNLKLLLKD